MDWPVTARTQVPHVRETIADRELETWAVVDLLGEPRLRHRRLPEARPGDRRARRRRASHGARRQPARRRRHHRRAGGPLPGRCPARLAAERAAALGRRDPPRGRRAAGRPRRRARVAAPAPAPPRPRRRRLRLPRRQRLGAPAARARRPGTTCSPIEVVDPRELELPDVGPADRRRSGDRPDPRGADGQRRVPREVRRRRRRPAGGRSPRPCAGPGPVTCSCAPTGTGSWTSSDLLPTAGAPAAEGLPDDLPVPAVAAGAAGRSPRWSRSTWCCSCAGRRTRRGSPTWRCSARSCPSGRAGGVTSRSASSRSGWPRWSSPWPCRAPRCACRASAPPS